MRLRRQHKFQNAYRYIVSSKNHGEDWVASIPYPHKARFFFVLSLAISNGRGPVKIKRARDCIMQVSVSGFPLLVLHGIGVG